MLKEMDIDFICDNLFFCEHLNDQEMEYLLNNTSMVKYKKGDILHNGLKECIGILLIKSGSIRTYLLSKEGREVTLYLLSRGECCVLSASCILKNITFDVTIEAQTDSEVYIVDTAVFDELSKKNVYVENFSYKVATERFSDVMWAMEQILFLRFDQRLAIFLLDESKKQKSDRIEVTHELIAKYLGSAREVVSRMLKYFVTENIVEVNRGSILIKDKKRLKDLIE